jgi:triosephosphate isomerase
MVKGLELSKINEILRHMNNMGAKYTEVSYKESDNYHKEKNQGEEGVKTQIFDVGLSPIFVQIEKRTDSYGSYEYTHSVQFVKAVEKTVIGYDPVDIK